MAAAKKAPSFQAVLSCRETVRSRSFLFVIAHESSILELNGSGRTLARGWSDTGRRRVTGWLLSPDGFEFSMDVRWHLLCMLQK